MRSEQEDRCEEREEPRKEEEKYEETESNAEEPEFMQEAIRELYTINYMQTDITNVDEQYRRQIQQLIDVVADSLNPADGVERWRSNRKKKKIEW